MNRRVAGFYCRRLEFEAFVPQRGEHFGECGQVRIFRNIRIMKYRGRIHEAIVVPPAKRVQYLADVELYHTGNSPQVSRQKLLRNLAVLQAETNAAGHDKPEQLIYYMDCYYGLKDYEKAVEYARKAIASGEQYIGMEGDEYAVLTTSLFQLQRPRAEIEAAVDEGRRQYPLLPGMMLLKGMLRWQDGDYLQAQDWLTKGILLKEKPVPLRATIYSDNTMLLLPYAYLYLGLIFEKQFRLAEAAECFAKGIQVKHQVPELFAGLYRCIGSLPDAEKIQLLNGLYDSRREAVFLTVMLRSCQAGSVYLYYARLAGMDVIATANSYMAAQRYDAAAVKSSAVLDGLYRLGISSALMQQKTVAGDFASRLPEFYLDAWQKHDVQANGAAAAVERMQAGFRRWHLAGEEKHG